MQLSRILGAFSLGLAFTASTVFASPIDFFDDLNRTSSQSSRTNRYNDSYRDARSDYQDSYNRTNDRYQDAIRRAEEQFAKDRRSAKSDREYNRALDRYQEKIRDAKEKYNNDLDRIGRSYERDLDKARDRYYDSRDRSDREIYDDYMRKHYSNGTTNRDWDLFRRREHEREWSSRRTNHYPDYDWDYGDYTYDRGCYSRYSCNCVCSNNGYRRSEITYFRDGRGDWGYYREHEDSKLRTGWNLSVDFSVPGNNGYVAWDPYTYGRGSRYQYNRWTDYNRRDTRLRYRNNEPSFRLAGGTDYWGDSFLFGSLNIPIH